MSIGSCSRIGCRLGFGPPGCCSKRDAESVDPVIWFFELVIFQRVFDHFRFFQFFGLVQQPAAPQDSLAAAARKAKLQKKEAPKSAKVFTNENLPVSSTISTVGSGSANDSASDASLGTSENGEDYWRAKFSKLRSKLTQDQADLAVMQRELGVLSLQNYSDPNVAMQQSYTRADLDKKNAQIDAKKKEIVEDQQAIDDAESDMQKAGGQPGRAR